MMTNSPRLKTPSFYYVFGIILGVTLLVWILRGLGVLSFLPGAIIWILLFLSIAAGVISSFQRR